MKNYNQQAKKIVVRDLKELADLFFPVRQQHEDEQQIGIFDDDERRMERDEKASSSANGRPR